MIRHPMVPIRNALAAACQRIADVAQEAARRLRSCPDCGRSLYYGEGCAGQYLTGCRPGGAA